MRLQILQDLYIALCAHSELPGVADAAGPRGTVRATDIGQDLLDPVEETDKFLAS